MIICIIGDDLSLRAPDNRFSGKRNKYAEITVGGKCV